MSISRQNSAIERFRKGESNVLIATSVVEEGFDVPECNLVIRLDAPSTAIALVCKF